MKMSKCIKVLLLLPLLGIAYGDQELNSTLLTDPHPPRLPDDLIEKSLQLIPGTKWCGETTSASSPSELGKETSPDKCCRQHYLACPLIEKHSTNFGLKNDNPYSVTTCSCDEELLSCLSALGTDKTAIRGRWMFFGIQHPDCFNFKSDSDEAEYADSPVRDPDLAQKIDDGEVDIPQI